MKNIVLWLLLLSMLPFNALADTYTVYDEKHRVIERWREKDGTIETFNKDWSRKGFIKKKDGKLEIYNKDWRRRGYGEREDYRDPYEEEEGAED